MEISWLQAFVSAATEGSFSAAAARLYLTQPAVSKRIAAIETELGAPLFDRLGRMVVLTEAGRVLLPRARELLARAAEMRHLVSDLAGEVGGPLLMGTSHHVGLRRLPPYLKQYRRLYPGVGLEIRFMDSEAACQGVVGGDLELAVVTLPNGPPSPLLARPIWRDPLAFVVAPDHPLAAEATTRLVTLVGYPAVLPGQGTYTRAILERVLVSAGLELEVGMSTNYLETLKMLVTTGLGWSLLPESMLDQDLCVLDVEGVKLNRSLGVVFHAGRRLSSPGRALLELLEAGA